LLRRVERRGAALLAVAQSEHAGAQLRELAGLGQRAAAHLLRRFLLAAGLDLAPVVLAVPLPLWQVFHLIYPPGLHRAFPDSCDWAAGIRSFLATIGPTRVTIA